MPCCAAFTYVLYDPCYLIHYAQRYRAGERDVASWFKHAAPGIDASGLLQPLPLPSPPLPGPSCALLQAAWSKADGYYFRSIACMQKLWGCAKAPHRDVSLHEVSRVSLVAGIVCLCRLTCTGNSYATLFKVYM